jgi:hypothetical protein
VSIPKNSPTTSMVSTSESASSGREPRWVSFLPLSQSSVRQKTAVMKVL